MPNVSTGGDHGRRIARLETSVQVLAVALGVFIVAHVPIVALLPKLVAHAPEVSIAIVVLLCAILAVVALRWRR